MKKTLQAVVGTSRKPARATSARTLRLASEPLLERLQDSVGRFEVREKDRFIRIIADLDCADVKLARYGNLLAEVLREFLNGLGLCDMGNFTFCGLAARMLKQGEETIGYDRVIEEAHGLDPAECIPNQSESRQEVENA